MQDLHPELNHYLPDHGTSAATTASRAVQYLNSLRPNEDRKAPLDSKPVVEPSQRAEYNRALMIAQKPLSVVDKITNGSITSTDVKHLQALYPDLYRNISSSITEQMVNHVDKDKSVPYSARIGIAKFLGQPMDSTMSPMSIIAAQPKPTPQNQPMTQAQRKSRGTAPLSKFSSNYMTQSQQSQARESKPE